MRHLTNSSLITPSSLEKIIPGNSTIIVGFSGGPDSVCLLHLLIQLKTQLNLSIIAAHLNHGWRIDANIDSDWCASFCAKYDIPYITEHANNLPQPKYNGSKEDLGRKLRRIFFEQLAHTYQANYIALAHHQDDQIETFFIRLLRGSSLQGLTGMKYQDGLYLRPLLNFSKQDLLNYLQHENLSYRTDSSNQEKMYLRNRIRLDLIPQLNAIDTRWQKTIPSSIQQLQQAQDFIDHQVQQTLAEISNPQNQHQIMLHQFLKLHPTLQQNIILHVLIQNNIPFTPTTGLLSEILKFLKFSRTNKHMLYQKYLLIKKNNYFYFETL